MTSRGALFVLASTLAACAHAPPRPTGDVEATLRAQTQAMLDAVTAGDAKVWERLLDPRATYVSESGTIDRKATLVPQITPLPKGISGKLTIDRFTVERFGDTAVVVYTSKETEDYFGHPLTAEYLTTDTWRSGPDGWRLVMSHVHVKDFDPPAVTLPAQQLDEYAGTYRLTDEIHATLRRDGAQLVSERAGRKPQALSVEACDVLFVPGEPRSRKIFQRDAGGRVTGFVDRREGHDVVWTRIAAGR